MEDGRGSACLLLGSTVTRFAGEDNKKNPNEESAEGEVTGAANRVQGTRNRESERIMCRVSMRVKVDEVRRVVDVDGGW